jgi:hypothetical protein
MHEENTTAIVQRYLDELTGEAPADSLGALSGSSNAEQPDLHGR